MTRTVYVVGQYAFVQHPCEARGYWARTDRCIAYVACPYCKAEVGEMCIGPHGRTMSTHHQRRKDYQRQKPSRKTITVIEEVEAK